ncbi:hypothetical protein ACHHV8_33500 [Paenibacillus sp. TAB 01]|uniref:hypothetical protein n=1 Tax=Paenibacillus sp. TAB 01 TaxID=3368988 RepID=UPI00374FF6E9
MAKEYEIAFKLAAQLGAGFTKTFSGAAKVVEGTVGKIGSIAKTATLAAGAVTAGIAALGAGALAATNDYQKAMNKVQMSTGATAEQMGDVSKIAEHLYGQNFGENWDEPRRGNFNGTNRDEAAG